MRPLQKYALKLVRCDMLPGAQSEVVFSVRGALKIIAATIPGMGLGFRI